MVSLSLNSIQLIASKRSFRVSNIFRGAVIGERSHRFHAMRVAGINGIADGYFPASIHAHVVAVAHVECALFHHPGAMCSDDNTFVPL